MKRGNEIHPIRRLFWVVAFSIGILGLVIWKTYEAFVNIIHNLLDPD